MRIAKNLVADTRGATVIEYGLIACCIAIAATLSMGLVGNALANTLQSATPAIAAKS